MDRERFSSEPEARALVARIRELVDGPAALMEVCGTHTVAISRFGIRSLMPDDLRLLSGPGCPVCVTPQREIDRAIAVARDPRAIVVTFGDMMRVPGSGSTLEREKASGADVRIVYSPLDALEVASLSPDREVVFLGIGFETTSPTIAATVIAAEERGIANFSVLPLFKLVPPALHMLAALPGRALDGFICPGHVSTIIGSSAYEPVASRHNMPCVVVGFEPLDILGGIVMLLEQIREVRGGGDARVENEYGRAVTPEGNVRAQELLDRVFEVRDSDWREIGEIEKSGYGFSSEFVDYDARVKLDVDVPLDAEATGCICGEIMLGTKLPTDCPLFATRCVPRDPVGPCMVSSEGACAAFYKYERNEG
ncbi:MAG: hydrogenase formation protein HypD [Candidatus Eisenbacteria bacterium]|nr:hydrogenase formation protein HypD [Candidatus Eisenbacteria bacterium]